MNLHQIGEHGVLKTMLLSTVLAAVLAVIGCVSPPDDGPPGPEPPDVDLRGGNSTQVMEVTVGPARKECYGPFRRMCLIVDGRFFYDEIDGFAHEPGYEYELRIEQYDAFPGPGRSHRRTLGRYGYRLLEVLSRSQAAGTAKEARVAPARVNLPEIG